MVGGHGGAARGIALGAGLLLMGTACTLAQRASVKVVDPTLVEHGTKLDRERRPGGFALGPYEIHDVGSRRETPDPDGPLASEAVPRPVTQHRAGLVLESPGTGRTWTTSCTLQRRPSAVGDYRAVLDENGDEIALDCTVMVRGMPPWHFETRTALSANFAGALGPEGGEPAGTVEVLTRVTHFKRLSRLLPVPVVQLRQGGTAVVATLLGRPERAWVAKDVDPLTSEAALALMLTLRFLPWELAE